MKRFQFVLQKIIYPSCLLFTVLWLLICGVIDSITETININFISGLMCYFVSLAIASANLILDNKKIAPISRYFLHMLFTVFSISIIVAIFSLGFKTKYIFTGSSFYLVLLLIVCYLIIATPLIVLYNKKRHNLKTQEYQPIFRK